MKSSYLNELRGMKRYGCLCRLSLWAMKTTLLLDIFLTSFLSYIVNVIIMMEINVEQCYYVLVTK